MLYPFLLTQSPLYQTSKLNKGSHDKIEFIYWFTNYPQSPIVNQYSVAKFDQDRVYLTELTNTILTTPAEEMTMTDSLNTCLTCPFQVYCSRSAPETVQEFLDADEVDVQLVNLI